MSRAFRLHRGCADGCCSSSRRPAYPGSHDVAARPARTRRATAAPYGAAACRAWRVTPSLTPRGCESC